MGKSLIIPGADFSVNAVERITEGWYFTEGTDFTESGDIALVANAYLTNQRLIDSLSGKTINRVRIKKAMPCTIKFNVAKLPIVG